MSPITSYFTHMLLFLIKRLPVLWKYHFSVPPWFQILLITCTQFSVDSTTLHTNLGRDWCRNMHQIDSFLRRNCLFTHLFKRVKIADRLQLWICLSFSFIKLTVSIILAQYRKKVRFSSLQAFKAHTGCHHMTSEIIVECTRHSSSSEWFGTCMSGMSRPSITLALICFV